MLGQVGQRTLGGTCWTVSTFGFGFRPNFPLYFRWHIRFWPKVNIPLSVDLNFEYFNHPAKPLIHTTPLRVFLQFSDQITLVVLITDQPGSYARRAGHSVLLRGRLRILFSAAQSPSVAVGIGWLGAEVDDHLALFYIS